MNMTDLQRQLNEMKNSLNQTGFWQHKLTNQKLVKKTFDTLKNESKFTDIQFVTSQGTISAHKFIFCQYQYFRDLIQEKEIMKLECSFACWETILCYCYGYGINFNRSTVIELYEVAQKYQFFDVLPQVIHYFKHTYTGDSSIIDYFVDVEMMSRSSTGLRFVESPLKCAILHNFSKNRAKYMLNDAFLKCLSMLECDFQTELITGYEEDCEPLKIQNRFHTFLKDVRKCSDLTIISKDGVRFPVNKALIALETEKMFEIIKNTGDYLKIDLDSSILTVLIAFFYDQKLENRPSKDICEKIFSITDIDLNKYNL